MTKRSELIRDKRTRCAARFWTAALLLLGLPIAAFASFTAPPNGARPLGMGSAFTAVADDANAPLYNPAGGAEGSFHLAFTRAAYFSGPVSPLVAHDAALLAAPFAGGTLNAGASTLADANSVYRETALLLGYARRIADRLHAGFLLKRLQAGVNSSLADVAQNPYFEEKTGVSAFTADVGLLAEPADGWTIGLAGQNIVPADLSFQEAADEESDRAPSAARIGTALQLGAIAEFAEQEAVQKMLARSLIAVDAAFGDGTAVGAGAEVGFSNAVAARVGYRYDAGNGRLAAAGAGSVTAGATIAFHFGTALASVDYAVAFSNNELEDSASQRVSLRARF